MKNLAGMTYRRKIFIGMLVAAVLPMTMFYLLITMAFMAYSSNRLRQEATESLQIVGETLDEAFDRVSESVEELAKSGAVLTVYEKEEPGETPTAYRQLYVTNKKNGKMADFCLYDSEGNLITFIGSGRAVEEKIATDWGILYEALINPEECVIRNAKKFQGTDREEYLRVARAICEGKEIKGFVVAVIDNTNMDYILKDSGIEEMGVIHIFDCFDEQIYSSMSVADKEEFETVQRKLIRDELDFADSDKGEYRYYRQYDEKYKINILLRQYYKNKIILQRQLVLFGGLAAVISIVISFLLSGFFSKMFYNPISKITKDIEKIGQGDYSARIDIAEGEKDEFAVLSKTINNMSETLEENTKSLVDRERELGNANIKMMQAQLNPHFIYNTLDTIKWMGKVNNVPEVATISSGLAKILRTSINSQQIVTLSQEIELVESYVEIQKIRFDDKFEFIVDIPENLMRAKIPKLILQPIIENCIVHGFEERDCGKILISASRSDKELFITVKDDGCGIDSKELEILNRFEPPRNEAKDEKSGSNIGVYNVHAIIGLHYGKNYGLKIESKVSEGTTVRYNIPYSE